MYAIIGIEQVADGIVLYVWNPYTDQDIDPKKRQWSSKVTFQGGKLVGEVPSY